jgi:hypothetical protein
LDSLKTESQTYYDAMKSLSELMPDIYAKLFGTDSMDNFIENWKEFNSLTGNKAPKISNVTSKSVTKGVEMLTGFNLNNLIRGSFATGTPYVPETGLYQLHKGEAVIPRNENTGGDTIQINITVSGGETSDLASRIAREVQRGLINAKTGKSKYRMR